MPASQFIAAIIGIGAAGVLAYYWNDIAPLFDQIVNIFKTAFAKIAETILSLFNILNSLVAGANIESMVKTAKLARCVAKHMDKIITSNLVSAYIPREIYFGPTTGTAILVYDIPRGTKGIFNSDLNFNEKCDEKFNYDKKITNLRKNTN